MGNPGYGNVEWKEKSGQAIAYQTDVKLRAKFHKPWTIGTQTNETQIGQEIEWTAQCSAIGPPGGTITSYIRYGQGIDKAMELTTLGSDMGLIAKSGSWYTLSFLDGEEGKQKLQGLEKVRQYLVDNPETYNKLYEQIKITMGLK
jgi:hypothetical protein